MSAPPGPMDNQLFDVGNDLLSRTPARLFTGQIQLPGEPQLSVLTIRTQSTTLSVALTAEEIKVWAKQVADLAAASSASGLTVVTGAQQIPGLRGGG